jgi:hypothetical protein
MSAGATDDQATRDRLTNVGRSLKEGPPGETSYDGWSGAPGRTRTCNLLFRRCALRPARPVEHGSGRWGWGSLPLRPV